MKIKMGGGTFTLNEDVMLNELRDILYETGKVQMNSINKQMAIHTLQNASRKVKSKEMKMMIAELIVAISTSETIQFIKEDTK